jgi:hypothetical protein
MQENPFHTVCNMRICLATAAHYVVSHDMYVPARLSFAHAT